MFHKRLNFIRKSKGFTAQQMADILHITLRAYQMYESGSRFPSRDTLVKIADTLDVSLDYLFCRDDFLKSHGISFDL